MAKRPTAFTTDILRNPVIRAQVNPLCPAVPRRTLAVIDANVVLNIAFQKATRPSLKTFVEQMLDADLLILAAPPTIIDEVERNSHRWSSHEQDCRKATNEFLRRVVLVEPGPVVSPAAAKMVERDVKDVPYARLYDYLKADVVLSKDRDWEVTGVPRLSGDRSDEEFFGFVQTMRGQAHVRGSALVGSLLLGLGWRVVASPAALALGGAYLMLNDATKQRVKAFLGGVWHGVGPVLSEFAENSATAQAQLRSGRGLALPARSGLTICDWLVRECVAAGGVALARAADVLRNQGVPSGEASRVRAAVVKDRRFILQHDQLRLRTAVPPRELRLGST